MEEIILFKKSVFKGAISNLHLLETIKSFIIKNKNKFTDRSWDCNIQTSRNKFVNILYEVEEFKYIKDEIEIQLKSLIKNPFMIMSSWINILNKNGYQEFHKHHDDDSKFKKGSASFYVSKDNSPIEFCIFNENIRHKIIPNQGDILVFDGDLHHRVVDSKQERISIAFNFNYL
tara:strand:+ start:658 stop:1179 length:522 start_codon:yes stop_codon:yes gene_type:complete